VVARVFVACTVAVALLCSAVLGAPPPPKKKFVPLPKKKFVPLPPPKKALPPPPGYGPSAIRCPKCNGTGWRWDNHKWKRCGKCNGTGWVYVKPGWWGPSRHHDDNCFVATAAYGTPWERNVVKLRDFRDQCLLQSPVGRGFVSLYYATSPPLAHWIADRPAARAATRVALAPAVIVAGALTGNAGDIVLVAGAMGVGLLVVPRVRRARKRRRA